MRRTVDASLPDARVATARRVDARLRTGLARPRGRHVRLIAGALAVMALWACSSHRLSIPNPVPIFVDERKFAQDVTHKLDLLFMIDDSSSMTPLQAKMTAQLGTFMDKLVDKDTGKLPDLHVAVVSSSMGGGRWSNVNGCDAGKVPGDDGARFLRGPPGAGAGSCPMLHAGERFLATGDGVRTMANYDGDIRDAFKCIALLGDKGCGFESQFKSVYWALQKALNPADTDNYGFLRDDAVLAIVMLTNEDDCSVPNESLLLLPSKSSPMDASGLGAFQNYRCNEFGHLCNGQPPPHGYPDAIPADGVTLDHCASAENMSPKTDDAIITPDLPDVTHGHLFTVATLTDFLKALKPGHPDDVLVAAIAGPPTPYRVVLGPNIADLSMMVPTIDHSCTLPTADPKQPEFADPAVRINQWIDDFGGNGIFFPICALDLKDAMAGIGNKIHQHVGASCLSTNIGWNDPARHETGHKCNVSRVALDATGAPKDDAREPLDECTPQVTDPAHPEAPTNTPCYQIIANHPDCDARAGTTTLFHVCENATCTPPTLSTERVNADVACAVE